MNAFQFLGGRGFTPQTPPTGAPPLDSARGLSPSDPLRCLLVFHILATGLT